jgi:hypothetical protein
LGGVLENNRDAMRILIDARHFGAIADGVGKLPRESFADPAHAADRLEHGCLKVVGEKILQSAPEARCQNVVQPDRFATDRPGAEAAAGIFGVAPELGRGIAGFVSEILVEATVSA